MIGSLLGEQYQGCGGSGSQISKDGRVSDKRGCEPGQQADNRPGTGVEQIVRLMRGWGWPFVFSENIKETHV